MCMDFHDFECQCSIHPSTIYHSCCSWYGVAGFVVFDIVFCNEDEKCMSNQLASIDELYKSTIRSQSKEIRLAYCNIVIDKAQSVLELMGNKLTQDHKKELKEKIVAAQKEVEKIITKRNY